MYYLKTRYYDPETGRFINADVLMSTGQGALGCNMFAYCLNNPVNMTDESGCYAVRTSNVMMTDGGGGSALRGSRCSSEELFDRLKYSEYNGDIGDYKKSGRIAITKFDATITRLERCSEFVFRQGMTALASGFMGSLKKIIRIASFCADAYQFASGSNSDGIPAGDYTVYVVCRTVALYCKPDNQLVFYERCFEDTTYAGVRLYYYTYHVNRKNYSVYKSTNVVDNIGGW